jgi:hypothetical protein
MCDNNDICYVCLKGETKKRKFYDPGCGCKGSIKVHDGCMRDIMFEKGSCECPVCKRTMMDYCEWTSRRIVYESLYDGAGVAKYTVHPDTGKIHGVYYEYHKESGEQVKMIEYENGSMHGEFSWWGVGGALKMQGPYVYGKKHGAWYQFAEDQTGYTEIVYYYDELIEYSRYNSRQEKVDYEYYGMESMRRLAVELSAEFTAEMAY